MYQPVLVPKIAAALLSPNPANINQKVKIIVTVEEETILLRPSFLFLAVMLSPEKSTSHLRWKQSHTIIIAAIYSPGRLKWQLKRSRQRLTAKPMTLR